MSLWLGPYMSIAAKTTFVQGPRRSRSAGKLQQIKQQKPNKQQDDPQIPQPDLRFVKAKNSKPDTQKGPEPKQKHPPTRFAKGHSGLTTVSLSKTCENELSTTTFKQQHRFIDNASVFFYRLCQDSNMFLTSSPPKVRDLREVSLQVQRQGHQGYI